MLQRLSGDAARRHVLSLEERAELTSLQVRRLYAIEEMLDTDGYFLLKDVAAACGFPPVSGGCIDEFERFRGRINRIAARVGVALRLELDWHEPALASRRGWFSSALEEASAGEAGASPSGPDVLLRRLRLVERSLGDLAARLDDIREVLDGLAVQHAALGVDVGRLVRDGVHGGVM